MCLLQSVVSCGLLTMLNLILNGQLAMDNGHLGRWSLGIRHSDLVIPPSDLRNPGPTPQAPKKPVPFNNNLSPSSFDRRVNRFGRTACSYSKTKGPG
jgi:hypothetical protein